MSKNIVINVLGGKLYKTIIISSFLTSIILVFLNSIIDNKFISIILATAAFAAIIFSGIFAIIRLVIYFYRR